jgi:peptidoglycan/LPS O-acetylase OafA/YrhL
MTQLGAYQQPTATFFLLITRGWELAIGACIAFYFIYQKQTTRSFLPHKFVDETLSLIGLLMIGYAVFVFDDSVPFPSFYALVPTAGTGLIICFLSQKRWLANFLVLNLLSHLA